MCIQLALVLAKMQIFLAKPNENGDTYSKILCIAISKLEKFVSFRKMHSVRSIDWQLRHYNRMEPIKGGGRRKLFLKKTKPKSLILVNA